MPCVVLVCWIFNWNICFRA